MKKKILVVDDEKLILQICLRVISELGFEVETAGDGQAALNAVIREDGRYEMVITDVKMPNMDGVSLIHMLKRRYPAIDVIMMTGFPEIEMAVETLKQGAYDYLIKPIDIDVLAACVNRCWEKRQMAAALNEEKTLRSAGEARLRRSIEELRSTLAALEGGLDSKEAAARLKKAIDALG